ncbi:transmembrane protein 42a isoform X2 [Callorhinchus milii]|uniref:transmembrane protein 42a isoform X2 n=1 Tax=Callorhinchus milii TaxID=7868 RepID=UPI00045723F1|nr:transmembrane protein 42a isoform X2 [Callorhinchus milii]|eukprot:gi/632967250/ref/XP_007899874.1/ PREDICTED: transmembrane protein 42 isoform X2 [Callorhinchus milii]
MAARGPGLGVAMALCAGALGALAATAAKLTLTGDHLRPESRQEAAPGELIHVLLRVGCGGLVFLFNALMWTFFAKALRYSSSSARASLTTTASNFLSSSGVTWWGFEGAFKIYTNQKRRKQYQF